MDDADERFGEEKVSLLLVDDRPSNLLALAGLLAHPEYDLVLAQSGDEALGHLLRREFALVLLDVAMPGMDGFEAAALIKQRAASRETPIVFVTASVTDVQDVARAYGLGAVDYLQKPLDLVIARAKVALFATLFRQKREIERRGFLLACIEEAVVATDPGGRVTAMNAAAEALSGCPQAEARGRRIESVLPLIDGRTGMRLPSAALLVSRGEPLQSSNHVALVSRSGRQVSVEQRVSAMRDRNGELLGMVHVLVDVTEERREAERRRLLVEASDVLHGSLDFEETARALARLAVPKLGDWCIVDLVGGQGFLHEMGVAHVDPERATALRELRASYPAERLPDDPLVLAMSTRRSRLVGEGAQEALESMTREPGQVELMGRVGLSSALVVPILAGERAIGALTLAFAEPGSRYTQADVTVAEELARRAAVALENGRLYEDSRAAIRLRDEFLSIASHELRTPLSALRLQLEGLQRLLARGGLDGSEPRLEGRLKGAVRQTVRLGTLIDRLLDVSRFGAGRLELRLERLDLAEVAADVVSRFRVEAERADCEVRMRLEGAVFGRWDRLRVEQVLFNLLSNAVKYGAGKPVDLVVSRDGRGARIAVSDRGIGVAAEDMARIFGRFERAVSPKHFGGLGLGLYIVRQIADAHGGTVEVSGAPGGGSSFVVVLPSADQDELEPEGAKEEHHGTSLERAHPRGG